MMKQVDKGKVHEIAAWLLVVVLSAVILKNLDFLFIPLSIALLLCYALGIPLEFLKKFRIPEYVRIGLVVLLVLALLYLLGRLVQANYREFLAQLPGFEEKFWLYAGIILDRLQISPDEAREMYASFLDNLKGAGLKPVGNAMQSFGTSFFTFFGNIIWVLLFMVFILAERESMSRRLVNGLGEKKAATFLDSAGKINLAVQHYLGLKTLVSLLTGLLVTLICWLFGAPFAILWGVVAFLLNFIPNIGSLVATVPPVAITLFQHGSLARAGAVAILITVVQMAVGNIVEPRLMGRGLNLSPLVVLLSLVFWGWMWGMPGMLLAVPLTAALKIAFEQIDATRPLAIFMGGGE